jgi:chromosome segregation ATPase
VARLKEECTKKDAKVEAQAEDLRQKNLDLENLRNDLEKAKGQTESCRTELGDVKKEKTELQEHSDKATGDAAKQIEQLQQQNRTLQQEADTTRSQNKSLGEDLGKANTAAEQMEKLQQEHSTQGKTIDDLKVQNEALQNRIETLETKPDQHHDHAANLQDEIQEMESDNQSLRDELEQANPAVEQMTELQQNYHETEHETLQKTPNTPDQHHDNAAERAATNEAGTNTLLSNETTTASQAELADVQTRATQAEKAANDADNQTKAASERYEDEQNQRAIPEHSITELETPRDQTEQQVAEHEGYYPQVPVEDEETFQTAVEMYENKPP